MTTCGIDELVAVVDTVNGHELSAPQLCREPKAFTVVLAVGGLEVSAEVCDDHERALSQTDGYRRSLKKRQT